MRSDPQCTKCAAEYCESALLEKLNKTALPEGCPIKLSPKVIEYVIKRYRETAIKRLYVPATITEKEAYEPIRGVVMAVRPRIKELVEFAKLLGFKKIGGSLLRWT